jgi:murein DD-endopeptidase MepM/ murein hydrolase activator NlpD
MPSPPNRSQDHITVSLGEQSAFAALNPFGAGYMIIVECESANDTRCTAENYVRSLATSVQFVGGSKGDPPADATEAGAGAPLPPTASADPAFTFRPAGELQVGSGSGMHTATTFAPGIRFPVERPKAYLNSQVWGIGGNSGPRGSWADRRNYAYPWRDNFCESRPRKTPACPSGAGHQGVDIRANGPEDRTYWAVATEDGRISNVGSYSVTLMADSGIQYRYLHLEMARLAVKQGARVKRGQRIGLISNDFGGAATTVHLHFEMLMNERGTGFRHVPPYTSLVAAYQSFR